MKVLQVNKFFWLKGGSERYFFDLTKLLENRGHEVIPFSMKDEPNVKSKYNEYFINHIDFSRRENFFRELQKASHTIYSFEAKNKLEKLIQKTKPDIAHLHNIAHQISPSILSVLKKYKIPVVQTLHDYKLICPNYKLFTQGAICERCKRHRYYQAVLHKCMKNSFWASKIACGEMYIHKLFKLYEKNIDLFIAPSNFLKDKLIEWGQDPKKLVHLPHFMNYTGHEPSFESSDYIIYFGRLSKEKGVDVLIKAMQAVNPKVKLKIVGTGPEEKGYKLLITNYKLQNRIEFVGYKSGKDLQDIIRSSMFVILPSVWYENLPMSILESFALGKAVVGSNRGGIPELVKDKKTGLLFELGNEKDLTEKINWLVSQPDKIVDLGKNARKLIEEKFSPEEHYKRILEIYNRLRR